MSREVDLSVKLSDEDRQYLQQRNRLQEIIDNDAQFSGEDYKDPADENESDEADENEPDEDDEDEEDEGDDTEETESEDLDSLTKDELHDRLDELGVEYGSKATKPELIALVEGASS